MRRSPPPLDAIVERARSEPARLAVVHNGVAISYGRLAEHVAAVQGSPSLRAIPPGTVAALRVASLLDGWVLGLALRSLGVVTVTPPDASEGWPGAIELTALPADARDAPARDVAAGAHLLLTSGTTGVRKAFVRTAADDAAILGTVTSINGITSETVAYVANFGLWTALGYRWPQMVWSVGGAVVMQQGGDLHRPLCERDLTHFVTTPDMLGAVLHDGRGALKRDDRRKLFVTGGTLPRALWEAAREQVTRTVFAVLSSTEGSTIAVTPIETADDLRLHRVDPRRHVEVVDEADRPIAAGAVGRLRVRLLDASDGYLGDAATSRAFFRGGWFYPGDLAAYGPDGRLQLHGRSTDVIAVLGDKVATAPIEQALQDQLGATGVCIVAVPRVADDDAIHVVIESKRPIDRAAWALAASALGPLARVPLTVHVVARLPRNGMGKVNRMDLRDQIRRLRTPTERTPGRG